MGLGQKPRVRSALMGFVVLAAAMGSLLPFVILAQTDSELPGEPVDAVKSKTMVCLDCRKRVEPVLPEDGSDPECPNDPSHELSPR
jgi:hypothetical protein